MEVALSWNIEFSAFYMFYPEPTSHLEQGRVLLVYVGLVGQPVVHWLEPIA